MRTYSVPAISCDHCRHAIETEVGQLPGVRLVTVDVTAKTVTVWGEAPGEAIVRAMNDAGYEVAGPAPVDGQGIA